MSKGQSVLNQKIDPSQKFGHCQTNYISILLVAVQCDCSMYITMALNNEEATGRSCLKHSILFISDHSVFVCLLCSDNPSQIGSVSVAIRIMDINDNPPSLTPYYEAFVCENAKAGQVRPRIAKKHTHTHIQGPNV